jgi:hypothetical protein
MNVRRKLLINASAHFAKRTTIVKNQNPKRYNKQQVTIFAKKLLAISIWIDPRCTSRRFERARRARLAKTQQRSGPNALC